MALHRKSKRPKRPGQPEPLRPAPQAERKTPAWAHALVILGLIIVTLVLCRGTFDLGFFHLDDPDYIEKNPYLTPVTGANIGHIVSTPYFANYAPGHLLSYVADIKIAGGKEARPMHVSNALWYAWVVCSIYILAFTLRPNLAIATACAGLFMVHPAHVEVFAWLSSRKDLVATGFAVIATVCYLRYRKRGKAWAWWYGGSIAAFLLASSGKQSVILLPAVFLAWDHFVEQRRTWQMLWDKIPYGLISVFFGWMTWGAQPSTRMLPDLYVLAVTGLTNLWLLTGFGDYVMYRPRPDPSAVTAGLRVAVIVLAILVCLVPWLFKRLKLPLLAALCCWILFNMVPPMTLSFLTPITDRYLFLPSVGACLLLCCLPLERIATRPLARNCLWIIFVLAGCLWTWKTLDYVSQWRDPRSVWFFAAPKVKSPQAYAYSGQMYQDAADRIHQFIQTGKLNAGGLSNDLRLAEAMIEQPERLAGIRAEWTGQSSARTNSQVFRDELWSAAWDQYEQAAARRGTLNTPNLFLRRGMILVNRGRHQEAIAEFQIGLGLVRSHTYEKTRVEATIYLQRAVGVAYWQMKNYKEAQDWLLKAQQTQKQSGQIWIPTIDQEVDQISKLATR